MISHGIIVALDVVIIAVIRDLIPCGYTSVCVIVCVFVFGDNGGRRPGHDNPIKSNAIAAYV